MRVYTQKAQDDGIGEVGKPLPSGGHPGASVAYLELHGYCEDASGAPAADDAGDVEAETTGVSKPSATGAVRRGRKVK